MVKEKKMDDVETGEEAVCKECQRPYYWGHYYPPPKKEPKKYFGAPAWAWVLIIVIILVVIMFVSAFIAYVSLFEPTEDSETQSFDVIISENGHYKYTLGYFYYEEMDVGLDIDLINGSSFDVYIMTNDQYESVYGSEDDSVLAFASIYSKEDIKSLSEDINVPSGEGELYLVIDNSVNPLSDNDADPEGTINVHVDIETTMIFYW